MAPTLPVPGITVVLAALCAGLWAAAPGPARAQAAGPAGGEAPADLRITHWSDPADDVRGEPGEVLALPEALQRALAGSSLVEAARAGTDAFEASLLKAQWTQWPHVKIETFLAPKPAHRGSPESGYTDMDDWGIFSNTEISGWISLYGFGKLRHLKRAAELGVQVGRAQEDIARAEVRFRVVRGFYQLALARELAAVVEEGRGYFDKAKRHVADLKRRDAPEFDPVDEMKIRVYDAQVRQREMDASRAAALALGALRVALGEDPRGGPDFATPLPEALVPLRQVGVEEALEAAVRGRPELVALRRGVAARGAEVDARFWNFFPDLVLVGKFGYGYSNNSDPQDSPFANDPFNSYTAGGGLALRWDLEIGKKMGEWREAKAARRKLQAELAEAERLVRLEVEKQFREMTDAREAVAAQQDALKAARGWVVSKLDLHENDLAPLKDVMDALVQFFQARLDLLKAVLDYDVAVAALERSTGLALVPGTGAGEAGAAGE